jgi:uncharacterized damage-inducible protein DinB
MEQMPADVAGMLLREIFLIDLKGEHATTARIISAIPGEKADYHPDPAARSAIELAWHIASSEMMFMDAVIKGSFDFSGLGRSESVATPEDVTRWYKEGFGSRVEKLNQVPDEQLAREVDFRGVLKIPAVMYLNVLLHHSIHHRGQLSTYLRPMGAKVPVIYGESYDSKQAKIAAQQTA